MVGVRRLIDTSSDRSTGYLYVEGEQDWPAGFEDEGRRLLERAGDFPIVAYQYYRDGAGCPWHADDPFGEQAILSLGVTRTFSVRMRHDDLIYLPAGIEHCVPVEDAPGERISIVFRRRKT